MSKDKLSFNDTQNNSITTKARTWVAVCWLESMISDWRESLDHTFQNPYVYCVHDKDVDSEGMPRKPHVHIMVTFPNTTTYRHALIQFNKLSLSGVKCANTAYSVLNVRFMYNYLIHDTDQARKDGKHLYDVSERVTGLNFDIGLLEQISTIDRKNMLMELSEVVIAESITNYADFYVTVLSRYDSAYLDVLYAYSGHFDRLCKAANFKQKQRIKSR